MGISAVLNKGINMMVSTLSPSADPSSGFPGGLHLPGSGPSGFHLREHHSESGVGGRER